MASKQQTNYFPNLPPYSSPKTGVLSKLPASWVPYAQLMRIDRPGGLYAFYFPYLIGITYAACIAPEPPEPLAVLRLAVLLLPFNVVMRGVACTWNDNMDQEFDRQVKRCRHRPIARGAVSTAQGHLFTLAQMLVGSLFLLVLPQGCTPHTVIMVLLFFVYALMKRITYFPQVVLGLPFAWSIFFCMAAFGMDPFAYKLRGTVMLVGANILWTIIYDTIYAHQDKEDDTQAGVKSMALYFKNSTKHLATVLAVGQVALLGLCGLYNNFGPLYYAGTVGGIAAGMAYYIYDVDLGRPESCGAWFHDQFWVIGAGFMTGLSGEYAMRLNTLVA